MGESDAGRQAAVTAPFRHARAETSGRKQRQGERSRQRWVGAVGGPRILAAWPAATRKADSRADSAVPASCKAVRNPPSARRRNRPIPTLLLHPADVDRSAGNGRKVWQSRRSYHVAAYLAGSWRLFTACRAANT